VFLAIYASAAACVRSSADGH